MNEEKSKLKLMVFDRALQFHPKKNGQVSNQALSYQRTDDIPPNYDEVIKTADKIYSWLTKLD